MKNFGLGVPVLFVWCVFGAAACSSEPNPEGGGVAGSSGAPAGTSGAGTAAGVPGVSGAPGTAGAGVVGGSAGSAGSAGASATAGAGGNPGAGGGGSAGTAGAGGSVGSGGGGGSGGGTPSTEKFSFFVTSMASMLELAKAKDPNAMDGFGGDLSYGETGAGAGLRGADKICAAIAEKSMPNNHKVWRAFLSATAGEDGKPVNAIDRIGTGPWYDRTGKLLAMNVAGLKATRPTGGDGIANDLPNEFGIGNHKPNANQDEVDNHDTLTGSTAQGVLESTNMKDTCNDWTSKVGSTGIPRIGHSWPRAGATQSWISEHKAGGCAPGVNIFGQGGPQPGDLTVGAGGGYGGIYCFALTP
jgi:hypothetical protein